MGHWPRVRRAAIRPDVIVPGPVSCGQLDSSVEMLICRLRLRGPKGPMPVLLPRCFGPPRTVQHASPSRLTRRLLDLRMPLCSLDLGIRPHRLQDELEFKVEQPLCLHRQTETGPSLHWWRSWELRTTWKLENPNRDGYGGRKSPDTSSYRAVLPAPEPLFPHERRQ